MGITAPLGVSASGLPPAGDKANAVVTGAIIGVGPTQPFAMFGPFNAVLYASLVSALTTTNGSLAASVAVGTGIAPGTAINSVDVPPGTTWATFAGTSGTLVLPTVSIRARASTSEAFLRGLPTTAGLLGAIVSGPGIPNGTTVIAITTPAVAPSSGPNGASEGTQGVVQLSAVPTSASVFKESANLTQFSFALGSAAVITGVDAAAVFTGAGITFSGALQLERSFDGGLTWIVCNVGGTGTLAQYTAGTPVSFIAGEPEKSVLYRWNCTSYTSGIINYRLSESGGAAMSLGLASAV